jgi:hypothetical protein
MCVPVHKCGKDSLMKLQAGPRERNVPSCLLVTSWRCGQEGQLAVSSKQAET